MSIHALDIPQHQNGSGSKTSWLSKRAYTPLKSSRSEWQSRTNSLISCFSTLEVQEDHDNNLVCIMPGSVTIPDNTKCADPVRKGTVPTCHLFVLVCFVGTRGEAQEKREVQRHVQRMICFSPGPKQQHSQSGRILGPREHIANWVRRPLLFQLFPPFVSFCFCVGGGGYAFWGGLPLQEEENSFFKRELTQNERHTQLVALPLAHVLLSKPIPRNLPTSATGLVVSKSREGSTCAASIVFGKRTQKGHPPKTKNMPSPCLSRQTSTPPESSYAQRSLPRGV